MIKKLYALFILLFILGGLRAQYLHFGMQMHAGVWTSADAGYFSGGKAWQLDYVFGQKKLKYHAGVKQRAIQWGNELNLRTSLEYQLWEKNSQKAGFAVATHNGAALFKQKSLYTIGFESMYVHRIRLKPRFGITAGAGIRWSTCPAYKDYSSISSVLEILLKVGIFFQSQ